jgi:hypothetical protein
VLLALLLPLDAPTRSIAHMQSRKKNVVIAVVIAGALSVVAAGTVAAQDYFFPLFGGYVDHVAPGQSPCGYTPIKTITPTTYEDTLILWYLCEDNRVIARRFFRTGGSSELPKPVYVVPAPGSAPTAEPVPTPTASCPVGFVPATGGGCVPPDHPAAAR